MPIFADKNLYAGVNPHLNSFLQNPLSLWEGFHSRHVTNLAESLDDQLPPGYHSESEKGLQISQITPSSRRRRASRSKADVLIYGKEVGKLTALAPTPPVAVLDLVDDDADAEYLSGIVIYRAEPNQHYGTPVTRIEVLSPANKAGGSHHEQYLRKRRESLGSGLNVVEMDYLHQLPPILAGYPSYASGEAGAYPFLVLVRDPHPTVAEGHVEVYGVHVDEALPSIRLPLAGSDSITFDLNAAYNDTCARWRTFREVVDYAALPLAFDRYSPDDQARIRARMAAIAAEYGE